jgi:hypothetical protein
MLIVGTHETAEGRLIAAWYARARNVAPFYPPYSAMAWTDKGGDIVAVSLFTGYNGANIDAHLVIKNPGFTPKVRRQIYRYVFQQMRCLRLTGYVPSSNTRLVKLVHGLGWRLEGALDYYFGPHEGDTALIYGLHAKDVDHGLKPPSSNAPRPIPGRGIAANL